MREISLQRREELLRDVNSATTPIVVNQHPTSCHQNLTSLLTLAARTERVLMSSRWNKLIITILICIAIPKCELFLNNLFFGFIQPKPPDD